MSFDTGLHSSPSRLTTFITTTMDLLGLVLCLLPCFLLPLAASFLIQQATQQPSILIPHGFGSRPIEAESRFETHKTTIRSKRHPTDASTRIETIPTATMTSLNIEKYLSECRESTPVPAQSSTTTRHEVEGQSLSMMSSQVLSFPHTPRATRRLQALSSPRRRSTPVDTTFADADADTITSDCVDDVVQAIRLYLSFLESQLTMLSSRSTTTADQVAAANTNGLYVTPAHHVKPSYSTISMDDEAAPQLREDSMSQRRCCQTTFAQHGEQLRMRGIQPSRRTNEIHMHIAPRMDTSVKHVIAW